MSRITNKDLMNDHERMIFNNDGYMGLPPGSEAVRTFRGACLSPEPEDQVLYAIALNKRKDSSAQSVVIKALDLAQDDVRVADPQMLAEYIELTDLIYRGDPKIYEISATALAQALESIRKRQDNQT